MAGSIAPATRWRMRTEKQTEKRPKKRTKKRAGSVSDRLSGRIPAGLQLQPTRPEKGLKKLITTSYDGSPIVGQLLFTIHDTHEQS